MIRFMSLLLILLLVGCGESSPPRGSAQDQAADAQARAETTRQAADIATVDAAKAKADADAARRRSQEADSAAVATPTADLIENAAKARIEATRAEERAAAAQAVAQALDEVAVKADRAATAKATDARTERDAESTAAETRHWVWICRMVGLIGLLFGGLIGGLLCWVNKSASPGLPLGAGLVTLGLLVVAFGQTITWLPMVLAAAVVAALVLWAWRHAGSNRLVVNLSHVVDAVEGKAKATIDQAKATLPTALKRAGMTARIKRLRGAWKRAESDAHVTAVNEKP